MKREDYSIAMRIALASLFAVASVSGCSIDSNLDEQAASVKYDDGDLDFSSTAASMTSIVLQGSSITVNGTGATASGSVVTITSAGFYSVSGSLTDGRIVVDSTGDGTVKVVLSGASVTCSTNAPFRVIASEKTIVTLAKDTANSLVDARTASSTAEAGAALYSDGELTVNGYGSLTIDANCSDGIASADGLKLVGGTISVDAVDDGLRGKDYLGARDDYGALAVSVVAAQDGIKSSEIEISGGSFAIASGNKGIQAEGGFSISGGTFAIVSTDDAINSDADGSISGGAFTLTAGSAGQGIKVGDSNTLTIDGDSTAITVKSSYEGIAGNKCAIKGGTVRITASNDGFSMSAGTVAGGSESDDGSLLSISGGYTVVTMGTAQGDGVDSNGDISLTGGTLIVLGPTQQPEVGIDFNGSLIVSGGTLVAAARYDSSMTHNATSATQNVVLIALASSQAAGTVIDLRTGTTDVITLKPTYAYQCLLFSSPSFATGSYTVYTGGSHTGSLTDGIYSGGSYTPGTSATTFTVSSAITNVGTSTGGGRP
jgi:hypothetical protein